jgi:hypothetical protein
MQDRGVRRIQTKRIINKRVREFTIAAKGDAGEVLLEPGRFAKRSPFDCGRPGCRMCHPHKANPTGSYALRKADRLNRTDDRQRFVESGD